MRQDNIGKHVDHENVVVSDPYEIAYLAGGGNRLMQSTTAAFVQCGAAHVGQFGRKHKRVAFGRLPDIAHDIEKTVYDAIVENEPRQRHEFYRMI